jgi:hypothetical protein
MSVTRNSNRKAQISEWVEWGPKAKIAGGFALALLRSTDGLHTGSASWAGFVSTLALMHSASLVAVVGLLMSSAILAICALDALKGAITLVRASIEGGHNFKKSVRRMPARAKPKSARQVTSRRQPKKKK